MTHAQLMTAPATRMDPGLAEIEDQTLECSLEAQTPDRLRLGMPHLDHDGRLAEGWVLRQAAHLHWQSIAAFCGCPIGGLRDVDGHRALPSIVSMRLTGDTGAFVEDVQAEFVKLHSPSPATGWRSRLAVLGPGGARLHVDLVSRFARRDGCSNVDLRAAAMPPQLQAAPLVSLPADVEILRARSRSMRDAAADRPPLVSIALCEDDLNAVGLVYFANFPRWFTKVETLALSGPFRLPGLRLRETHWYGNADVGDTLDLTCDLLVTELGEEPTIVTAAAIRRRSDGAVIAVSETRRGPV